MNSAGNLLRGQVGLCDRVMLQYTLQLLLTLNSLDCRA